MILFVGILSRACWSACTSNPLRDVYLSSQWTLFNTSNADIDTPSQYAWIDTSASAKVSSFTAQTPDSDNWCVPQVLGSVTQVCCSSSDIDKIGIQYMAKFILGTLEKQEQVVNAQSLFQQSDFSANCQFVSNPNQTKIVEAAAQANRSIYGMYYGIAKWVIGFVPLGQAEVCLICANDASITDLYTSNTLKVKESDYDDVVKNMAKGQSDYNAAQKEFNTVLLSKLKSYFIDNTTSSANCSTIMDRVSERRLFCQGQDNCVTFTESYLNTTGLQYETFFNIVSPLFDGALSTRMLGERLLSSRLLTTTAVTSGFVPVSSYNGLSNQVTIAGASVSQLEQAYSSILHVAGVLILSLLI